MTDPAKDPVVARAVSTLRDLPAPNVDAIARIVAAAADTHLAPGEAEPATPRARWLLPLLAACLLAALGTAGFLMTRRRDVSVASGADRPAAAPLTTVSDAGLVPTTFAVTAPRAGRVALVADFNNWNPSSAPMIRQPNSDVWTAVVAIPPGRHVYGFLIDSAFTADAHAPAARDPDLGVRASVILVGRP